MSINVKRYADHVVDASVTEHQFFRMLNMLNIVCIAGECLFSYQHCTTPDDEAQADTRCCSNKVSIHVS